MHGDNIVGGVSIQINGLVAHGVDGVHLLVVDVDGLVFIVPEVAIGR